MRETLIHPPKTMLEVWESLPEGTLCQLINNKLIISPAPKEVHQQLLNRINVKIFNYLEISNIGEVRIAPYDVHFSDENIVQPDLLFIKNLNLKKIKEDGFHGVPDIIVEVLSPSTSQIDFDDKKSVYERFGVPEYFIVDPNTRSVDSFFLVNNKFEQQKDLTGKIDSRILGTKILF